MTDLSAYRAFVAWLKPSLDPSHLEVCCCMEIPRMSTSVLQTLDIEQHTRTPLFGVPRNRMSTRKLVSSIAGDDHHFQFFAHCCLCFHVLTFFFISC